MRKKKVHIIYVSVNVYPLRIARTERPHLPPQAWSQGHMAPFIPRRPARWLSADPVWLRLPSAATLTSPNRKVSSSSDSESGEPDELKLAGGLTHEQAN